MKAEAKNKRVVFNMGGKGGVGKTGLMVALAEWFEVNEIPFTLLDLDTENKARGSLKHFFNGSVAKLNIHTPAGLDAFAPCPAMSKQGRGGFSAGIEKSKAPV